LKAALQFVCTGNHRVTIRNDSQQITTPRRDYNISSFISPCLSVFLWKLNYILLHCHVGKSNSRISF